ncbi:MULTISPECIES: NAD(P)/FAD-dependent oxidoreductase [unclassified Paenibacillus]|uniref:NAD(P)/FAD-dependent oxidoreductase n=1 Tax=unclassified Paenibacillus TaxID=185978 RepID=UPI001C0F7210|nr:MULTISPECIES: NAD(P)/FAD-dependent oxidoreductase [unclassified Paenibacillus]MBU5442953.1 NAD(P)/FAD-dependent oxidoreductase [Paenibacillus sp. MSJ-34]CAH0119499.1 NADH dehydrogenase-like protein YjlD [Paenibacillus sp. CECT 9249]
MAKHIVILGGGYGGLLTALTARKYIPAEDARITVVNRNGYHQIVTELHRLAVGGLNERNVALPLDKLLRKKDVDIVIGTVQEIALEQKRVSLASGTALEYDALVIALGSETAYFGIPGLEEHSFTLKSVEDANRIRAHVEACLDSYSQTKNKADATFVIGGGGLSGIELIGELADTLPQLCLNKGIDFNDISLYCVEAAPSILPGFAPELVERAKTSLEKRGVTILTGVAVTEVQGKNVILKDGTSIETNTLVWTGGVTGNKVVADSGIEANRGRATVNAFMQSTSHQDVFLAGDSAVVMGPEGRPYPPSAQIAWQMGELVGYNLFAYFKGAPMKEFQPVFSGTLASLGRKDAIGTIGGNQTRLKGMPASLMKEASNIRYLSHINGLSSLVY